MLTPDELLDLTTQYHDLGVHRTGTAPDLATADWFFGLLEDRGAALDRREVIFDRYDVSASLVDAGGEAIPTDAVYYEFLGRFEGTIGAGAVDVSTTTQNGTGNATTWTPMLTERDRPLVVVVEDGPAGEVVMPNRAIGDCERPPAIVVPSDAAVRLDGATMTVDAQLVPGICEASSAVLGDGPPVTITTPLSGWFGCASERGSGAAVAIDLAARLAETHTVTVVACSGHELDHLGLHTWLDDAEANGTVPPGPVIHLGASVAAAVDGVLEPRIVLHDAAASPEWAAELAQLVEPAAYRTVAPEDPWPGEGRNWRPHTPHVLSFTGAGHWFHTAGDTPARTVTAAALGTARDAVWAASSSFLRSVG